MEFNEEKEFERVIEGGERDVRSAMEEWNAVAFAARSASSLVVLSPFCFIYFLLCAREIKSGRNREKVRVLDFRTEGDPVVDRGEEVMTQKIAGKKGGQTQKKSSERRQSKNRSRNDPVIAR